MHEPHDKSAARLAEKAPKSPAGWPVALREALATLAVAMLLAVGIRSYVAEPFTIPSESMLPSLMVGDYLFVAKWPYGYSRLALPMARDLPQGRATGSLPKRGDIVVFRGAQSADVDYVKRVIGLPGDVVQMRRGRLFINGLATGLQREGRYAVPLAGHPCPAREVRDAQGQMLCSYRAYRETLPGGANYIILHSQSHSPGDNTKAYRVPQGHIFVMGDNRDNSADSRFSVAEQGVGYVPLDHVLGRAAWLFLSADSSARLWNPLTWGKAIRWQRIGATLEAEHDRH